MATVTKFDLDHVAASIVGLFPTLHRAATS
jgi:hypothetical protein